jgi:hypothetical protein
MICFFYFTQDITIRHKEHDGFCYTHCFEGVQTNDNVPINKIYFSTPSDFFNQMANIKKQSEKDIMFAVDPKTISSLDGFPKHIGFGNIEENIEQFKHLPEIKIGIVNAMSNAIGDHLIGMKAFETWHKRLSELLPNTKIRIALFQLSPHRLADITRLWADKIDSLYMLPNSSSRLFEQNAYIDLGTLLLRDGFDTENMMDFFLKSLSVDPNTVAPEDKRIKYQVSEETLPQIQKIMRAIRSKGRPVLLFHRTATAPIREIEEKRARKLIAEIIKKSDYFVISAEGLDYQNSRFMDVGPHSISLDHFAGIISQVDGIITVDTCTYHFADAFGVPTVALFSTIDPELRSKYYPYVVPVMYETRDGKLFGKHKASVDPDELKKELEYLSTLWDKIDVDDLLNKLKEVTKLKLEGSV